MILLLAWLAGASPEAQIRGGDLDAWEDWDDWDDDYDTAAVPEPGLALSPEQRFRDVPLPTGLRTDPDRTYVFESASLQLAQLGYTTRHRKGELAQFFISECPAAGWELKNVLQTDIMELHFEKPGRELVVKLEDRGFFRGRQVTIRYTPQQGQ